jgi:hypothetical protein
MKDGDEHVPVTPEDVRRCIAELLEMGLIVDSGRKRRNPRTGKMETVYVAAEFAELMISPTKH